MHAGLAQHLRGAVHDVHVALGSHDHPDARRVDLELLQLGLGLGLLVAIFISNLPEATGSASEMLEGAISRRRVLQLWTAVAVVCTAATVAGWGMASAASDNLRAAIDGFAAGALLVMLIDSMIPDARRGASRQAGLVATLGFAVAAGLSSVS